MIKHLLLSAAVALTTLGANAYTAQEIVNHSKYAYLIEYFPNGTNNNGYLNNVPYEVKGIVNLQTNSAGSGIIFKDFFKERAPWTSGLTNFSNLTLLIDGNSVKLPYEVLYSGDNKIPIFRNGYEYISGYKCAVCQLAPFWYVAYQNPYFWGYYPVNDSGSYKSDGIKYGAVSKTAEGEYIVTLPAFAIAKLGTQSGPASVYNEDQTGAGASTNYTYFVNQGICNLGNFELRTFTPNSTASHTEKNVENATTEHLEYPVKVKMEGNKVTVDNWLGRGIPFYATTPTYIYENWNNEFRTFDFYLNVDDLTFTSNSFFMVGVNPDRVSSSGLYQTSYIGVDYNFSNHMPTLVNGIIGGESISHKGQNKWPLSTSETITVLTNPYLQFDDFSMLDIADFASLQRIDKTHEFTDAIVKLPVTELDITHSCCVNKEQFGYGGIGRPDNAQFIYVKGNIEQLANAKYVEDYEVYIIPGSDHDPYSSTFNHDIVTANATKISDEKYYCAFNPSTEKSISLMSTNPTDEEIAASLNEGTSFNLLVPESDLVAKNANGNYSVYVKAKYIDESGLEETYHAMTPLGMTTTGIADVLANDGNEGEARYYDLQGVEHRGDKLAPGVYIRRQGATATKVIVK